MSFMTEEQVKLLHKLQMVGLPAFKNINPLTIQEEEARDLFRMNLPPLEWINAVAENEKHEFVEKRFLGVSENNCREQMKEWLEQENLTLFQQPNPQFGAGEIWNEYFSQPLKSVNFKALTDLFSRWEIPVATIPIPHDEQEIIRQKSPVAEQNIYRRLDADELRQELQNLRAGSVSEDIQFGFAPGDINVFEEDTTFYTFLSPLKAPTQAEWEQLAAGRQVEELSGQIQLDTVSSDVERKPYYALLSPEELQTEIEYFQVNGEFRNGIKIGYASGNNLKTEKSVEPFVTELSDEELDQLEAGTLADLSKLRGQKLLGFSRAQEIPVFRRLTSEELQTELKSFAETGHFSNSAISIGHIPERETHKKEFHRPLVPLSNQDLTDLAAGKTIRNQDILLAQRLICRTPQIPGTPVYEMKFSALELAFDDCPQKRLDIYARHQRLLDERERNKITPELRAQIKALQESGKGPKIDRESYLAFTRKDAETYIRDHEHNPENTFAPTVYPRRAMPKNEAFPQFRKSNLFSQPQADYLQRSILRDLAAEGHIGSPETTEEFLQKLEFITETQAKELIQPHLGDAAGAGLMNQCRAYIESGKIFNDREIRTISDVQRLYQTNRGLDFDKKAALKDLIDGGYIQSSDALAKIKYTTDSQDDALIAKYGDAKIGRNLRARINDLIDDAKIGQIADEDFQQMSIAKGMRIIAANAEIEHFKHPMATPGQIELLRKMELRGQIDLHKIDLSKLRFRTADQWIKQNIKNPPRSRNNADSPATPRQRSVLSALVRDKRIDSIPYPVWRNLTVRQASEMISRVQPSVWEKNMARENVSPGDKTPHSKGGWER